MLSCTIAELTPSTPAVLFSVDKPKKRTMPKRELETKLEDRCVARIEALGGLALKLRPPTGRGFPDRTVLLHGRVFFIEAKRQKTGVVAVQQDTWRRLLTLSGFGVYVVDSDEQFEAALKREMER